MTPEEAGARMDARTAQRDRRARVRPADALRAPRLPVLGAPSRARRRSCGAGDGDALEPARRDRGRAGERRRQPPPLGRAALHGAAVRCSRSRASSSCRSASGCWRCIFVLYETAAAWVFAGTTRYRVPWDFVLALLAAAALDRRSGSRSRRRRRRPQRGRAADAAASVSSTSAAIRSAYSSGVAVHLDADAAAPSPSRAASSPSVSTRSIAAASACVSPGRDEEAVDAVLDDVRDPACAGADHRPAADERLDHDPRQPLGGRRKHERRAPRRPRRASSGGSRRRSQRRRCPRATQALGDAPSASRCRRGAARRPGRAPRRAARPPRAPRRSCSARARRRRSRAAPRAPRRAACPRTTSRSTKATNSAAGSTPTRPDEPRGEGRDRPAPRPRGGCRSAPDRGRRAGRAPGAAASRRASSRFASRRGARRRAALRCSASPTSAASYGLCVRIAAGRRARASRRTRNGQAQVEERPVEQRRPPDERGTRRRRVPGRRRRSRARGGRTARGAPRTCRSVLSRSGSR